MNREKTHLYKKQHLIAENGLSTNTYTKKSSYTTEVTHLLGEDNVKFAEEWILHINPLIGIQRSSK